MTTGKFDHRRLIECLTSWRDDETGELVIGIKRDGIHSFESLILARYQMSTQVYYHRLRRIYDFYLESYFRSLDKSDFDTPEKIMEWTDIRAMNQLFLASQDPDMPGHAWAERIVNRRHHKDVFSLDEGDTFKSLGLAAKVFKAIQEEYSDIHFVKDLPNKPISIHKIARDDDREENRIDFPLLDRGRRTSLGDRSQILRHLAATFRVGFIFADVDDANLRRDISTRCRAIRNEQL